MLMHPVALAQKAWKAPLQIWAAGLAAAFVSGGASAVTAGISVAVLDSEHFNAAGHLGNMLKLMVTIFLVNGLHRVFSYLSYKPLPGWDGIYKRDGDNEKLEEEKKL